MKNVYEMSDDYNLDDYDYDGDEKIVEDDDVSDIDRDFENDDDYDFDDIDSDSDE